MEQKLRKIIKTVLLISAVLGVMLVTTAGIFSDEVKLKNVSAPFIDLDAMVEDLPLGDGGNEEKGQDSDSQILLDTNEEAGKSDGISIEIREKTVKLNGQVIGGNGLKESFESVYKRGMRVLLIDDFAEYHTFVNAKKMLEEKGIVYQESQKHNIR